MPSLSLSTERLILVVAAGLVYWLTYQVNSDFFTDWVFTQGVSLVYLPAGIKLLAILIAGVWGAMGITIALFVVALDLWSNVSASALLIYAIVSTGTTYLVITQLRAWLRISDDLGNLDITKLAIMDGVNAVIHGLVVNAYFFSIGARSGDAVVSDGLAMSVGDFVGSGLVLMSICLAMGANRLLLRVR